MRSMSVKFTNEEWAAIHEQRVRMQQALVTLVQALQMSMGPSYEVFQNAVRVSKEKLL
jgi:hypothetical protein